MPERPIAAPRPTAALPRAGSLRAARWVRRALLPVALVAGLLLYLNFGVLRVPPGMDTTPQAPPGSLCVIDKRASSARAGNLVFVDLPDGGTLLSRLAERGADGSLRLHNDNSASRLPDSRSLGPLPAARLRGTVVAVFPADAVPELPRDR